MSDDDIIKAEPEIDPAGPQERAEATADDRVIDADFEPAPEPAPTQNKGGGRGPGWFGAGVIGLLAAGAGGAIGVLADKPPAVQNADNSAISAQIDTLVSTQADLDGRLLALKRDTDKRLDTVSAEALAAQKMVGEIEMPVVGSADDDSAPSVDAAAIDALEARLTALETLDPDTDASPADVTRAVTAMDERVSTLNAKIDEMAQGMTAQSEKIDAITRRLSDLEYAVADVSDGASGGGDAADTTALREEVNHLKQDIEAATTATTQAATSAADASAALLQIEAAARQGRSFPAAWQRLSRAMPGDSDVAALKAISDTGAPTLASLRGSFARARTDALDTDAETQGGGWSVARRVFGDTITVRRDGEAGELLSRLSAAEAFLAINDLPSAITVITDMEGAGATAMRDWLASATKRASLEDRLDNLRLKVSRVER